MYKRQVVMKAFEQGSMGNHPGVAEYKGQWYFFYMNEDLPEGHEKRRAVNVIPLIFNENARYPNSNTARPASQGA